MAMASLHLLPRNTSSNRKMHLSLSPSLPPALCNSFPLLAVRANPLRLQLQPQRSTGLVITKYSQGWIPPTPSQFEDPFSLDHKFPGRGTKRGHEDNQESHPDEPDRKRQRGPDGKYINPVNYSLFYFYKKQKVIIFMFFFIRNTPSFSFCLEEIFWRRINGL